jgi:hypothetical protein
MEFRMRIYIAKPNTWFKEGTEVRLIEYLTVDKDGLQYGVFEGLREKLNGEIVRDSEVCSYDEFNIIEE